MNRKLSVSIAVVIGLIIAISSGAHHVNWASESLKKVEIAAARGDRYAELELGKRYEDGDGVPKNLDKAIRLYRSAANTTPQITRYHAPIPGSGHIFTAITEARPPRARLPEAERRLEDAITLRKQREDR